MKFAHYLSNTQEKTISHSSDGPELLKGARLFLAIILAKKCSRRQLLGYATDKF